MNRIAPETVGNRIKRLCSVSRLGEPLQNTAMNGIASISIVFIAFLTTSKGMIIILVYLLRADVCKYRPEVGKIKFLKNPQKIMYTTLGILVMKI